MKKWPRMWRLVARNKGGVGVALLFSMWLAAYLAADRTWLTGLLFFIPTPVCAVLVGAWSLVVFRRSRWLGILGLVACALPVFSMFFVENHWGQRAGDAPTAKPLKLVHWNIWYEHLGRESIHACLRAEHADVYVLSEVPSWTDVGALGRSFGSGYRGLRLGDMAIIARGEVRSVGETNAGNAKACLVDWQADGCSLKLLAVDIPSNPFEWRVPMLRKICAFAADRQADIIVGDFNTPRRSVALRSLPEGYVHAYDAVGAGWSYTWPEGLPCLAIDQCILGPRVFPVSYRLRSPWLSDHRMQVLEFALSVAGEEKMAQE